MNIFLRVRMFENIVVRGLPIPHKWLFWQMLTVTSLSSSLNQWYCTYLCHHFFIMVQFSYSIFSTYKHAIMSCFVIPWGGNDIKFRVFSQSVNCCIALKFEWKLRGVLCLSLTIYFEVFILRTNRVIALPCTHESWMFLFCITYCTLGFYLRFHKVTPKNKRLTTKLVHMYSGRCSCPSLR